MVKISMFCIILSMIYYYFTYSRGNVENIYDERTFGNMIYEDPCIKLSNIQFRKYVNSKILCVGDLCVDGKFSCKNTNECYDVEHIIDLNGPEFTECNKNIAGNMIMAWSKWNRQLGSIARTNYTKSILNKTVVYGEDIMSVARDNIKKCCNHNRKK